MFAWGSNFSILHEGRVAEVKLLFTKLQEEITTVKKSVTQWRVETGTASSAADFPVIELKPEPQSIEQRKVNKPTIACLNDRKAPLAFDEKAERVYDVVDLKGTSKNNTLAPVTYSTSGALKALSCPENFQEGKRRASTEDCSQEKISVYRKPCELETFPVYDDKRARYEFTTRKFIATQEMIEYHSSREKRLSFEVTI